MSRFSRSRWLIRSTSTSLWVRSSSLRSPDSRVIEGRTWTGGTGRTVRTIHSGRPNFGLRPIARTSSSGIRSSRARTSFGVILWPFSRKVVGLSRMIFCWTSWQCGQTRSSFGSRVRTVGSSESTAASDRLDGASGRIRPQARHVPWRRRLISFA